MQFDIQPALTAAPAIQIHLATVIPAFFIGTYLLFFSKKGAPIHRTLGWIYLGLMTATAISAIFVRTIGGFYGFSLIHLFVPLTFFAVVQAIWGAKTHNIKMHRGAMIGLYIGGLLIAGGLTFLPGRVMHRIFFG
jgi:uncharacterized membrane protein